MPTIDITKTKIELFDLIRNDDLDFEILIILAEKVLNSCQTHDRLDNIDYFIDVLRYQIYDMKKIKESEK